MAMKDSGIEWIGEIPEDWDVSRVKYNLSIHGRVGFKGYEKDDLVGEGEGAYTIGGKHITNNCIDLSNAEYISWEKYYESPEIMVKIGDILIAQRGTLGKVAIIDKNLGEATINPSLAILNESKINEKYVYWYFMSDAILTEILMVNTTTAVPMISQTQIGNFDICVPTPTEQKLIAAFLDDKVGEIDNILSDLYSEMEILQKYKITVITESFDGDEKTKVKYIGELQNGVNFDSSMNDELVYFLGVGDFQDNFILNSKTDFSQIPIEQKLSRNDLLQNGDIVFVRSNGSKELVGRSIMVDNIDYPLTFSGFCIRLRNKRKDVLNKYLLYFFKSNLFRQELNKGSMGTNISNLSQPVLGNIIVPMCTIEEQQKIIDYLDKKCTQIDEIIKDKQTQIEKMESYKKSLIYEYVTGKKRVKGVV